MFLYNDESTYILNDVVDVADKVRSLILENGLKDKLGVNNEKENK